MAWDNCEFRVATRVAAELFHPLHNRPRIWRTGAAFQPQTPEQMRSKAPRRGCRLHALEPLALMKNHPLTLVLARSRRALIAVAVFSAGINLLILTGTIY